MFLVSDELSLIPDLLAGVNPELLGIQVLRKNKFTVSQEDSDSWTSATAQVITLLNTLQINYVVINYLNVPHTISRDLDLLIENKEEIKLFVNSLQTKKFLFNRGSAIHFFTDSKLTFESNENKLEVDIYPRLAWSWWKTIYSPVGLMTEKTEKTSIGGAQAKIPSPTLNIYSTIVHCHAHSKISLAEIAHVVSLIVEKGSAIDWDFLKQLICNQGLEHTFFLFLSLTCRALERITESPLGLKLLIKDISKTAMSRLNQRFFRDFSGLIFPLYFPNVIRFLTIPNERIANFSYNLRVTLA